MSASSLMSLLAKSTSSPEDLLNNDIIKHFTKIEDEEGNSKFVICHDGVIYPPIPSLLECLPRISTFKKKSDDVFICAYPYSGTHWMWEVTSMILRRKAERIGGVKEEMMLEVIPQPQLENIESPRVLNTHILPSVLPSDVISEGKIILMMRNPKDVAVSAYRQLTGSIYNTYEGSFSNFFNLFIKGQVFYGDYFKYHLSWLKAIQDKPNVLIVSYEEASQDLENVVSKIAKFLQVELEPDLCKDIADLCTFKKMKAEKKSENIGPLPTVLWKPNVSFYRTGKVATWKNWLTVSQSERLDERLDKELEDYANLIQFNI
ncbi:estrogen sulfotransferase-like [Octopus vulgaris]|uniref:Estrogen sulfotransferase-like n=2 Tax=Octopus TaxID=6643 RepID=A0AA36FNN8_OCTVU|nr:sulfotransferase 6B1-like [Octopus sinensis]XP_036368781.1 sulfotransferase 6B1-like [Octopus sinensis]CAI9740423.1 estrogen sulfotransferase-like [Octopus vulgaris]